MAFSSCMQYVKVPPFVKCIVVEKTRVWSVKNIKNTLTRYDIMIVSQMSFSTFKKSVKNSPTSVDMHL